MTETDYIFGGIVTCPNGGGVVRFLARGEIALDTLHRGIRQIGLDAVLRTLEAQK